MLAALSVGLSGFTIRREIGPHDEGLMLQAAARIAAGQRPYRDFRLNYPPGQPFVLAVLHRAIGPSLLGWRLIRLAVDASSTVLAYRLTGTRASEPLSLASAVGVAGAMAFPSGASPNPPAQMLALGALLTARSNPQRAAVLAGITTAFRIEVGIGAAAGVALLAPRGRRLGVVAKSTAVIGAALGPFAVDAPREMFEDTIGFYAIQRLQRLPLPLRFRGPWRPSKLIEFYAPAILLGAVGTWAATILTGDGRPSTSDLAPAPLAIVGTAYLLARTDEFHLVPLAATLPIALAHAAAAEPRRGRRFALLGWLALIAAHGLDRKAGQALHPPRLADVPGRAGRGVQTSPEDARALAGLLCSVHQLTVPGEPIFVANPRHDFVRVGNPLLYTLLERPNPTRYDVMQPGVVTTELVQREIVGSLAGTSVVVRWVHPTACNPEPNGAGRSSGVDILDRYLAENFRERSRHGDYVVLVRSART